MPQLNGYEGRVVTIDARTISEEALGKYFPNSPMLAAVVATTGVMPKETFLHEMRASYKHKFEKKPEVIENIFTLMKAVSSEDTVKHFDELYNKMQIRYGDLKKQLAEDMIIATSTIRERINDISNDHDYLRKVAHRGAEKARESASKTIRDVREIIGFKSF